MCPASLDGRVAVYVVANVTDNNDGTYNCTYVLPSSGSFYLSAFYYDETINTTYTIVGYSRTIRPRPAQPRARTNTAAA